MLRNLVDQSGQARMTGGSLFFVGGVLYGVQCLYQWGELHGYALPTPWNVVFIAGRDAYYEFEINALNTTYEVFFIWTEAYERGGFAASPEFSPSNLVPFNGVEFTNHPRGKRLGHFESGAGQPDLLGRGESACRLEHRGGRHRGRLRRARRIG